jgi:hypothetical protein
MFADNPETSLLACRDHFVATANSLCLPESIARLKRETIAQQRATMLSPPSSDAATARALAFFKSALVEAAERFQSTRGDEHSAFPYLEAVRYVVLEDDASSWSREALFALSFSFLSLVTPAEGCQFVIEWLIDYEVPQSAALLYLMLEAGVPVESIARFGFPIRLANYHIDAQELANVYNLLRPLATSGSPTSHQVKDLLKQVDNNASPDRAFAARSLSGQANPDPIGRPYPQPTSERIFFDPESNSLIDTFKQLYPHFGANSLIAFFRMMMIMQSLGSPSSREHYLYGTFAQKIESPIKADEKTLKKLCLAFANHAVEQEIEIVLNAFSTFEKDYCELVDNDNENDKKKVALSMIDACLTSLSDALYKSRTPIWDVLTQQAAPTNCHRAWMLLAHPAHELEEDLPLQHLLCQRASALPMPAYIFRHVVHFLHAHPETEETKVLAEQLLNTLHRDSAFARCLADCREISPYVLSDIFNKHISIDTIKHAFEGQAFAFIEEMTAIIDGHSSDDNASNFTEMWQQTYDHYLQKFSKPLTFLKTFLPDDLALEQIPESGFILNKSDVALVFFEALLKKKRVNPENINGLLSGLTYEYEPPLYTQRNKKIAIARYLVRFLEADGYIQGDPDSLRLLFTIYTYLLELVQQGIFPATEVGSISDPGPPLIRAMLTSARPEQLNRFFKVVQATEYEFNFSPIMRHLLNMFPVERPFLECSILKEAPLSSWLQWHLLATESPKTLTADVLPPIKSESLWPILYILSEPTQSHPQPALLRAIICTLANSSDTSLAFTLSNTEASRHSTNPLSIQPNYISPYKIISDAMLRLTSEEFKDITQIAFPVGRDRSDFRQLPQSVGEFIAMSKPLIHCVACTTLAHILPYKMSHSEHLFFKQSTLERTLQLWRSFLLSRCQLKEVSEALSQAKLVFAEFSNPKETFQEFVHACITSMTRERTTSSKVDLLREIFHSPDNGYQMALEDSDTLISIIQFLPENSDILKNILLKADEQNCLAITIKNIILQGNKKDLYQKILLANSSYGDFTILTEMPGHQQEFSYESQLEYCAQNYAFDYAAVLLKHCPVYLTTLDSDNFFHKLTVDADSRLEIYKAIVLPLIDKPLLLRMILDSFQSVREHSPAANCKKALRCLRESLLAQSLTHSMKDTFNTIAQSFGIEPIDKQAVLRPPHDRATTFTPMKRAKRSEERYESTDKPSPAQSDRPLRPTPSP